MWSAAAIDSAPDRIEAIHREYARAGATVHTANTFRTTRRASGPRWRELLGRAVAIARESIPASHRLAGSIAPLEDCYRPDLSPPDPRPEHRDAARALADAGVDLILCETFPSAREATIAVDEAVRTGLPVWAALTAGPRADLMTPDDMAQAARDVAAAGASAVLVNCTPAARTLDFVRALAGAGLAAPIGAYANAGSNEDGVGWDAAPDGPRGYADLAGAWIDAGATIVGACCGAGPGHIAELARRFAR
jgi:S-methylmethionine-dependent homocysteine/selenocysteine methylase